MTVTADIARWNYTGNGVLVTYPFTAEIYAKTDLKVYVDDVLQTVDVDYTIATDSIEVAAGGNVVFDAGSIPALSSAISIVLDLPLTQLVDYIEGDKFPAETHERALDRLIKIAQSYSEVLKHVPKLPTSSLLDLDMPTPSANDYIGWNAAATNLANKALPVATTATQYEVDALVSYGSGSSYTKTTLDAALTAIGTSDLTTLLLRPGTWVLDADADYSAYSNVFFKVAPGAQIQPAAGVSLTVYSPEHILASPRQQIIDATNNSTNPLLFTEPGTIYGNWWDEDISDGTTIANDIFTMVNAGMAAGSEVVVLPAVSYYKFDDEFIITKAAHFHGLETSLADIRQSATSKNAIKISASIVEIDHLKITGPQYASEDSSEHGIWAYGTSNAVRISDINIHDNIVQEFGYSGIRMGYFAENFKINDNKVLNCWKHGIIVRTSNYGEVIGNKIKGIVADGAVGDTAYGLSISTTEDAATHPASSYIRVAENLVDTCIHEALSSHYGNHLTFENNQIINTASGIAVQSSALHTQMADHISIIGNQIERGTYRSAAQVQTGIFLKGSNDGTLGTNNVIMGNTVDGFGDQDETLGTSYSAAVEVRFQDGVVVQGNNIYNSGRIGIHYRSVANLNASGNIIDTVSGTGPVKATGTITFANNPSNGDTITINGAEYTFVDPAAPATDYEIDIKASLALTLDEVIAVLNAATTPINSYPTDGRVSTATYTEDGTDTLTITYDYPGRNGNYFTLAASADTVSGANLTGGEVGSSAIVIEKLSGLQDPTGKMSNEVIDVSSSYAGIITEPDVDIAGLDFNDIQIKNAGCKYDMGGSGGTAPNEAARNIVPFDTVNFTYDLPSINQDSSYTFYVPLDGTGSANMYGQLINQRNNLGLVYGITSRNNYIEVAVWNLTGGAIDAGSQKMFLTMSRMMGRE